MSIHLDRTSPQDTWIKTHGDILGDQSALHIRIPKKVPNQEIIIPLEDFAYLVEYVLVNSDLHGENDPRLKLIERIKTITQVPGYNSGLDGKR